MKFTIEAFNVKKSSLLIPKNCHDINPLHVSTCKKRDDIPKMFLSIYVTIVMFKQRYAKAV